MTGTMFNRVFLIALIAGVVAGVTVSAVQSLWAVPLIHTAERYETAAAAKPPPAHLHADGSVHVHEHQNEEGGGITRVALTVLTNVLVAFGFALILGAIFILRRRDTIRSGVLWGLAGFAVFSAAPALGLPPELPGTEAAAVADRQAWWFATVLATAAGLALLVFARQLPVRLAGPVLVLLPHLFGAPQPAIHGALAPAALQAEFVIASLSASAVMWLVLGAVSGFLFDRFDRLDRFGTMGIPVGETT